MDVFTLSLVAVLGGLLYYYFYHKLTHFERLGVPHDRPLPIVGNVLPCIQGKSLLCERLQQLYKRYSDAQYFGFFNFQKPVIVIRDPELITNVAVKNFDNFCDHRRLVDEKSDPLMGANLFTLRGDDWRDMRKLLSPSFTSSKMKMMFSLVCDCARNLVSHLAKTEKTINTKEIFGRYTNDVVATCAFGISIDSMKYPNNDFYHNGRSATDLESALGLKFFLGDIFVMLSRVFGVRMVSKRIHDFFLGIISETVKTRDEQGIRRPDMIQLMMESKDANNKRNLTIEQMTAQAFVFFFGGFDTTSTFMCFLAHELAAHSEVQEKLRAEIEDVLRQTEGKPTYEAISQMKYLEAVSNEVLRLYPQLSFLDRTCVKDFQLPPATPGARPVTVKKGESVWFPSYALQRDEQFYPEPDKFDPERFMDLSQPDQATFMTFGIGPRYCIGNRFALMQAKVLMFYLLSFCELTPIEKNSGPTVLAKKFFLMVPEKGFFVKIRPLDTPLVPLDGNLANGVSC